MDDVALRYCSDHPDVALVPVDIAWAPSNVRGEQRRCPTGDHNGTIGHRCAWCGGPIPGRRAYAAIYCGGTCRVAAHRAGQPVTRGARIPRVTAIPGTNAAAAQADAGATQEVQE